MADDREVLREVWQGRIPTAFTLYQDDVEVTGQPDPYYLMLPRLSYISIINDKVRRHFSRFLSETDQSGEMWFDFQGTPLKWHLPVGVLYDQICVISSEPVLPPWSITVHFGSFPQSEILKWDTKEVIESHFMSCIKEADQIKHGGKVVSSMQKKDHNQLWQGLHNDKFDQFWAVNRRLMETRGSSSTNGEDDTSNSFKHIPFRLYEADQPVQQRLIKPNLKLDHEVPDSSSSAATVASSESSAEAATSTNTAGGGLVIAKRHTTLKDLLEEMLPDKPCHEIKVITQGISPELDTPLQWMSEHLSYPDNFLHICVR